MKRSELLVPCADKSTNGTDVPDVNSTSIPTVADYAGYCHASAETVECCFNLGLFQSRIISLDLVVISILSSL